MKAARYAAVTVAVVLLLSQGVSAQDQKVENFDSPPTGWELASGTEVVDGVLRVPQGGSAHRAGTLADFEFSVRVRIDDTSVAAIMYRASEQGRYSVFLTPDWAELVREATQPTVLAGADAPIHPGEWVDVSVVVNGSSHTITVAGVTFEAADPDPYPSGEIGFRVEGEGVVEFDELTIAATDSAAPAPPSGLSWIRTGGPLGGLGYDVRMDPTNADRMYVTDAYAGVFVSDDGGQNWYPSNEGITTRAGPSGDAIPVFSLSIDPNDADILWAGTQNTRGIFRSTDGGKTWVERDSGVEEFDGITFRGFGVEPGDSDTIYGAAELSSWLLTGEEGKGNEFDLTGGVVYKTTDGGDNWKAVWRGDNLARYVWFDPTDTATVYVSTGIFDREAANSEPNSRKPGGVGVLKSTDGGATWEQMNNGLGNLYVNSLFIHPENPEILLAGTGNNTYGDGAGVFRSVNGGDNWIQTHSQGSTSVEFAISDPDIAYAANAEFVFRSEDGGETWETVAGPGWGPPGIRAGFPIDIQVDPTNPDRLFANNYGGGNFVSDDGGTTWQMASSGYTGAQVRDVAVSLAEAGRVFAAARSGLFTSADGGTEWVGLISPPISMLEWNAVSVDPTEATHVLAGTNWDGALAESHDGGDTWAVVFPTLGERLGWRSVQFAPSNAEIVYGGTGGFHSAGTFAGELPGAGIWVSTDGGTTWKTANDALTDDAQVATIAIHPTDSSVVYAASTTDGILRTNNGGSSWEVVGGLPTGRAALSIAIDPTDPQVLLAGFQESGIYRSTDGGQIWTPQPAGLAPEAMITDIVFDPTDPTTVYGADMLSGVYRSTDNGQTWAILNEGLRTRAVAALAISSDGDHLYAATEGEGMFRLDLTGTPPPEAATNVGPADDLPVDRSDDPTEPSTTTTTVAATPAGESGGSSIAIVAVLVALVASAGGAAGLAIRRRSH